MRDDRASQLQFQVPALLTAVSQLFGKVDGLNLCNIPNTSQCQVDLMTDEFASSSIFSAFLIQSFNTPNT